MSYNEFIIDFTLLLTRFEVETGQFYLNQYNLSYLLANYMGWKRLVRRLKKDDSTKYQGKMIYDRIVKYRQNWAYPYLSKLSHG